MLQPLAAAGHTQLLFPTTHPAPAHLPDCRRLANGLYGLREWEGRADIPWTEAAAQQGAGIYKSAALRVLADEAHFVGPSEIAR